MPFMQAEGTPKIAFCGHYLEPISNTSLMGLVKLGWCRGRSGRVVKRSSLVRENKQNQMTSSTLATRTII